MSDSIDVEFPSTFTIINEPEKEVSKYCAKCGSQAGNEERICKVCNTILNVTLSDLILVPRGCPVCGKGFKASFDYFEKNPNCPDCGSPLKYFDKFSVSSNHVVIDGVWDSKDRGKVIREKNDQVKAKFSGYSYEQKSIKEKVTSMVNSKINNNI
jgi:predicted amidophosphoribosyltransferase